MSAHREEHVRRRGRILFAVLLIVIALIGVLFLLDTAFEITKTDVSGCVYSQEEDILEALSAEEYSSNSLLLFLQLKSGRQPEVEFVESVQVKWISPWHICLEVTEKTLCGVYRQEDGSYTYFDSSGNVVEISETGIDELPELEATSSGDASIGAKLVLVPSGSMDYVTEVFGYTQQYGLDVTKIALDTSGHITFDTSGITVILGSDENTAEKFKNLSQILDRLEGRSGSLDFSAFSSSGDDIIFSEDE